MSYIELHVFKSIEARLLSNRDRRLSRGPLSQDFDCVPGEVFYANLKQEEFDSLPLKCKRKGGPARTTGVFSQTFEALYKDRESFAVFLHTFELDLLGIKY